MNVTLTKKIKIAIVLLLISATFFALGFSTFTKAQTLSSVNDLSLNIGAGEMLIDEEKELYGLKFSLSLPADEYELLRKSVGAGKTYEKMETGLIIAPSYYADEIAFTEASLFSSNSSYDWATYDAINDVWNYDGNKIQIININANIWTSNGSEYTYDGSIVNILEQNETELFLAMGYVRVTDFDGVETVKFTNPTYSRLASVAMSELEGDDLTESQAQWVADNWIYDVTPTESQDLVLVNVDILKKSTYSFIDAVPKTDANYGVLKGFGDYSNVTVTLTDENGNVKTVKNAGAEVPVTTEEYLRLWTVQISCGETLLWTGRVDLYSLNAGFLWNNETTTGSVISYSFAKSNDILIRSEINAKTGAYDNTINGVNVVSYKDSGGNGSWFVWKPLHSQSYYQNFTGKNLAISLTIYVDGSNKKNSEDHVVNQGFINGKGNYLANVMEYGELTSSITLDNIVNNWATYVDAQWDGTWATRRSFGMAHVYNVHNGGIFSIGNFKIALDPTASSFNGGEILVDLDNHQNKNQVDLSSYIRAEHLAIIESYAQEDVSYQMKSIYSNDTVYIDDLRSVNLSTASSGMYVLSVKSYDLAIYSATIDLFSSSASAVWANDFNSLNVKAGRAVTTSLGWSGASVTDLAVGSGYQIVDASTVTDVNSPLYGKTGKFIKITAENSAEQIAFSVKPMHTMGYYKKLLAEKDYVLTFNVYAEGSFRGMSGVGAYRAKDTRFADYVTWRGSVNMNSWLTYSLPFDSYLLCDSADDSFSTKYLDYDNLGTKIDPLNTMFQFEANSIGSTIYVEIPYIETMPDVIAWTSAQKSIDMQGMDTVDLSRLFDDAERNKYEYYGEKYGFNRVFFRVKFADSTQKIIWAKQDGRVLLDLGEIVGVNDAGATVTIDDLIDLGAFSIDGRLCDPYTFPGHSNIGIFGEASGCNNNQKIVNATNVTLTNRPDQIEVYEIAVADSTLKMLREDYSQKLMSSSNVEGNVKSICVDNVQDLSKALKINVFKNETENAQIQIVSKTDILQYKVILSDLVSGSNVLSKENITPYHLLYTYVARNAAGTVNPTGLGEYPDAILPMNVALSNNVATLKAGKNQGIWVSFNIPADQPAGLYTGLIRIKIGVSVYDVPVEVNVYDYAVDEEVRMKTALSIGYSNILNLETPYEYDEEGNLIVNSSGNKTGELSQEIVDAYIEYFTGHKISTSPVVKSSHFAGSWQGYPYDPSALFSFDRVTVKGKQYYAYEWPLRKKDADGNTILEPHVDTRTGYESHGYPLNLDRVDEYFNALVDLAGNPGVTTYTLPTYQAVASNFNYDNVTDKTVYPNGWAGVMNEIRDDMPNGTKAYVINQLVMRDYIEMFFQKTIELHKNGKNVDVFKKARLYPTWIDEFGINASKTHNAQYLLSFMKTFFPDCANWLKRVYATQIGNDQFLLGVLDSLSDVKIGVTTNTLEDIDPNEHYANLIPVLGYFNTENGRQEIEDWKNIAYGGEAQKWIYTAGNVFPETSNNIDQPYVVNRIIGWIMSEYDIEGYLYWSTLQSKYMDGIVSSIIKPIIGETVKDGDIIKLDDFYNNAIHYGGVAGDGFLVYPGQYYGVKGPVGTIRVDALTDAIEDYNLFYDLKAMYNEAGVGDSYYTVMRRLCEMLYTGVRSKVPAGYTNDFEISRDSLANMLMMARDNGVFMDDVFYDESLGGWVFTVIAPRDIASSLKASVNASYISSENLTLNGVAGVKMKFALSQEFIDSGYVTVTYDNKTINLSVETLIGTKEVEALHWADVDEDATVTYHNSYYSNGYKNTHVDYEIVTLSENNSVGGRTSGNYYYVSPVNNSTANIGFAVLPETLTKEEVKKYIGKAELRFDVYMVTTNIEDGSLRETWKVWYKLGKATNSQTECHRWFTVTIDFQQIYDNWETLMITEPSYYTGSNDDWSTARRALFAVNGESHSAAGVHTTSYYIGNFRITHV